MTTRVLARRTAPVPRRTRAPRPARPWWPWVKNGLALAFLGVVVFLLQRYARTLDWGEVRHALQALPWTAIAAALALAATSHALYSTFDLLGRHYTGHRLPVPSVMGITFVSYAFNLNLGSLVGGVAFRLRLYSRLGLEPARITQVMSLSMLTNWLGYLLLAGGVCLLFPPDLPEDWKLKETVLPALGAVVLALPLAWVGLCAAFPRQAWTVRGHRIELPGWRLALLQIAMSCTNWAVMAGVVFTLLQQAVPYTTVLGALLLAAVAGVITHVPAGLGVLEAVFVALLAGPALPQTRVIAALLCYRALYYLLPLACAAGLYLVFELRARRAAQVP